jgi:hypothetical protein
MWMLEHAPVHLGRVRYAEETFAKSRWGVQMTEVMAKEAHEPSRSLLRQLRAAGYFCQMGLSDDWPDLIVLGHDIGLLLVDIYETPTSTDSEVEQRSVTSSRRTRNLISSIPSLSSIPRKRRIVVIPTGRSFSEEKFERWLAAAKCDTVADDLIHAGKIALEPAFEFARKVEVNLVDTGRGDRESERFRLDDAQASAVDDSNADIRIIEGPAGSGKTLVLLARAKRLAATNPNWNIQFLCYSSVLVKYVETFVWEFENIHVDTFHGWQRRQGHLLSGSDCDSAQSVLSKIKNVEPNIDVLLVDEIQDFCPAWLTLALMYSHWGRGGAFLAGDSAQDIYHRNGVNRAVQAFPDLRFERIFLGKPYRSTRQILDVVSAMNPSLEVENKDLAPDGLPVDLVWTPNRIDDKARFIAYKVQLLVTQGVPLSRICVTAPFNHQVRQLAGAFQRADVPVEVFWKNQYDLSDVDFQSPSVKVMTAWKAKGLGFDTVFMVGFDEMGDPLQPGLSFDEQEQRQKFSELCLVAPSRAENHLSIVYSTANVFINNLLSQSDNLRELKWPLDFEEVANG